jgi:hypothetical protein
MNGVELLDILLKAQYEGNLEKMKVYFYNVYDEQMDGVYSGKIDDEGDLVLNYHNER